MADKPSTTIYHRTRDDQHKFDYFVATLTGTLFAYIAQTYTPRILAPDPTSFEPFALILLAISFFLGLKRIELVHMIGYRNFQVLDHGERAETLGDALLRITPGAILLDAQGETIDPRTVNERKKEHSELAELANSDLKLLSKKAERYYRYRNHFLLGGFVAILLAKLTQPYY